jgi:quercetin dioxygenase-like cupin family protein
MKQLNLKTEIGEGQQTEVTALFDGPRRKLIQVTLRDGGILKAHKAAEPITVMCVTGKGSFVEIGSGEEICLSPGVLLTVEAEVMHEVRAEPAVSILLTKFKQD